jgi:hypothetical protein
MINTQRKDKTARRRKPARKGQARSSARRAARRYEVERKFKVSREELTSLMHELHKLGFEFESESVITDCLLHHTDGVTERVRRQQIFGTAEPWVEWYHTRKTHPLTADGEHHVRQEEEEEISAKKANKLITLAFHNSPRCPMSYSKVRREFMATKTSGTPRLISSLLEKRYRVSIAFDTVKLLNEFSGHYMEIEVLVPLKDADQVKSVQRKIKQLAHRLLGDKREPSISYSKMLAKLSEQDETN